MVLGCSSATAATIDNRLQTPPAPETQSKLRLEAPPRRRPDQPKDGALLASAGDTALGAPAAAADRRSTRPPCQPGRRPVLIFPHMVRPAHPGGTRSQRPVPEAAPSYEQTHRRAPRAGARSKAIVPDSRRTGRSSTQSAGMRAAKYAASPSTPAQVRARQFFTRTGEHRRVIALIARGDGPVGGWPKITVGAWRRCGRHHRTGHGAASQIRRASARRSERGEAVSRTEPSCGEARSSARYREFGLWLWPLTVTTHGRCECRGTDHRYQVPGGVEYEIAYVSGGGAAGISSFYEPPVAATQRSRSRRTRRLRALGPGPEATRTRRSMSLGALARQRLSGVCPV